MLAAATISAPFAGKIAAHYAEVGEYVTPGTPIVRLVATDTLWVRFAAPEQLAGNLSSGAAVMVTIEAVPEPIRGTVRHAGPEIDLASQTFPVEAFLALPDSLRDLVRPGMIAHVQLAAPGDL
jgi:membrane fusion protein (multidrug efflux system)